MINFNTENIVVVCFMGGTSGRFLMNSLGLSDNAVLQHARFAERQLNGELTPADKLSILKEHLDKSANQWIDLGIDCYSLFGVLNGYYELKNFSIKDNQDMFNEVVETLSNSDKKFFIAAHSMLELAGIRQVWPKSKVIYIVNSNSFITFRSSALFKEMWINWDTIRGEMWPVDPPNSVDDYYALPDYIKLELANRFNIKIEQQLDNINLRHLEARDWDSRLDELSDCLVWDNDNCFYPDKTIQSIKELYQKLNLQDFNKDMVAEYHRYWMTRLEGIR